MINTLRNAMSRPTMVQRPVRNRAIFGFVAAVLFFSLRVSAQPIARPFAFTLPSADTSQSSMLGGLSPEAGPAGKHGAFHLSPEGHFVAADGTRIKFFGTEIQWTTNFIDGRSAEIFAKRLHKMGFNALRLNAYDYWGWDDASVFSYTDSAGHVTRSYNVNAMHLHQLDTLLYWLKQEGIYIFLPIHAYHAYGPNDGVAAWDSIYYYGFFGAMLYPEALQAQRNWARTLLNHVNPLTGTALRDDPQIACYEVSFEESLPFYWRIGRLNYIDAKNVFGVGGLQTIGYGASRRLDTLYSQYLQKKYGSDAALAAAWSGGTVNGTNLLANGSFETFDNTDWNIYSNSPARGVEVMTNPGYDASPAMMIHITKIDNGYTQSGVVFYNTSNTAKLAIDTRYELSFRAKLLRDAQFPALTRPVAAFVNTVDNGQSNLASAVTLDTTWREYKLQFRCIYPGQQNVGVILTSDSGNILFDAFSLHQIPDVGLAGGETIAGAKIQRILYDTMVTIPRARARDQVMFYDSLEQNYYNAMVHFIRDTLHAAGLVNATAANYGATSVDDRATAGRADVMEVHTGWDYLSSRPNGVYNDSTWMVRNYAMVTDAGFYTTSLAAAASVAGKAMVVGAWYVPAPNQHASEQAVIPVAYACFQDWDGIFFGPYVAQRDQLFADTLIAKVATVGAYNNISSNHAFMAQMPLASYAFRNSLVPPAAFFDTIHHDANDVFDLPHYGYRGPFGQPGFQYGDQAIVTSIGVRQKFDTPKSDTSSENIFSHTYDDPLYTNEDLSKTSHLAYNPSAGTFMATEPNMYAYTGLSSDTITFPRLTIQRLDAAHDQLSMYYLLSPDSGFGLLSISTRTQNSGVVWLDTMGYGNHYGHAPTVMSAAKLALNFQSTQDSVIIAPLDASGNPTGQIINASRIGSSDRFTATIDQQITHAAWYLVIEKSATAGVATQGRSGTDWSIEVSPNPATSFITISSSSSVPVKLSLIDDLGREVAAAVGGEKSKLDVRTVPNGHYIVIARSGNEIKTANVTVMR